MNLRTCVNASIVYSLQICCRYGKAIDRHGIVVRMNVAPTKGFEDKVGSKTTFRLLNNKHATAITRCVELLLTATLLRDVISLISKQPE